LDHFRKAWLAQGEASLTAEDAWILSFYKLVYKVKRVLTATNRDVASAVVKEIGFPLGNNTSDLTFHPTRASASFRGSFRPDPLPTGAPLVLESEPLFAPNGGGGGPVALLEEFASSSRESWQEAPFEMEIVSNENPFQPQPDFSF
jgi:hypothetical protein